MTWTDMTEQREAPRDVLGPLALHRLLDRMAKRYWAWATEDETANLTASSVEEAAIMKRIEQAPRSWQAMLGDIAFRFEIGVRRDEDDRPPPGADASVAFSFTSDGAGGNQRFVLWREPPKRGRRPVDQTEIAVDDDVQALGFDHDARWLAVGIVGQVVLVDVVTRRVVRTVRLGVRHDDQWAPWRVMVGDGGKHLLVETIGRDGESSAVFMDIVHRRTKTSIARRLTVPDDTVGLSRDGGLIALGSPDGTLELYDATAERLVARTRAFRGGDGAAVAAIGFAPGGNRVAAASWSGELALYDVAELSKIAAWRDTGAAAYGAVAIAWDGSTVVRTVEPTDRDACRAVVAHVGVRRVQSFAMPSRKRFTTVHVHPTLPSVTWCGTVTDRRSGLRYDELVRQDLVTGKTVRIARPTRSHQKPRVVAMSGNGLRIAAAFGARVRISDVD